MRNRLCFQEALQHPRDVKGFLASVVKIMEREEQERSSLIRG
jgi:hypothetical protein